MFELNTKIAGYILIFGTVVAFVGGWLGLTHFITIPQEVASQIKGQVKGKLDDAVDKATHAASDAAASKDRTSALERDAANDRQSARDQLTKLKELAANGTRVGVAWMGNYANKGDHKKWTWNGGVGYTEFVPFDPPFSSPPRVIASVAFKDDKASPMSAYVNEWEIWNNGCNITFRCDKDGAYLCDRAAAFFIAGPRESATQILNGSTAGAGAASR